MLSQNVSAGNSAKVSRKSVSVENQTTQVSEVVNVVDTVTTRENQVQNDQRFLEKRAKFFKLSALSDELIGANYNDDITMRKM